MNGWHLIVQIEPSYEPHKIEIDFIVSDEAEAGKVEKRWGVGGTLNFFYWKNKRESVCLWFIFLWRSNDNQSLGLLTHSNVFDCDESV